MKKIIMLILLVSSLLSASQTETKLQVESIYPANGPITEIELKDGNKTIFGKIEFSFFDLRSQRTLQNQWQNANLVFDINSSKLLMTRTITVLGFDFEIEKSFEVILSSR